MRRDVRDAAAIAIVAALLRLPGLGADALWLDEANGVLIASRGVAGILDSLARDGNPPLFYLLLHGWIALFGDSEAAVRSLALAFGVAGVVAVFAAGRVLFPARRDVAIAAAALVAIGPLHVHYSQEARMYTLAPLVGVLALTALQRALASGRARWFAAHAALLAAGLYTHNYFLFMAPVAPIAALLAPGRLGRARAFAFAAAASLAAALVYAPWIPVLIAQAQSGVGAWIAPFWEATPPALALVRSFEVMGVGGSYPRYLFELGSLGAVVPAPLLWLVARVAAAGLAIGAIALALGAALRRADERDAIVRLATFTALPLALAWAASFAIAPIYLVGRYEMVAFTGYALLVARGFAALRDRSRALGAVAAVTWLALAALTLGPAFAQPPRAFEREVAAWLGETARDGDAIVFPGYTRTVSEYYLRRWNAAGDRYSFPAEVATHLGWFDATAAESDAAEARAEAESLARSLAPVLARGGRVVLVTDWTGAAPASFAALRSALVATLGAPTAVGAPERPTFEIFERR